MTPSAAGWLGHYGENIGMKQNKIKWNKIEYNRKNNIEKIKLSKIQKITKIWNKWWKCDQQLPSCNW